MKTDATLPQARTEEPLSPHPAPSHTHTPVAVVLSASRMFQAVLGGNHEAVREEILSNSWSLGLSVNLWVFCFPK